MEEYKQYYNEKKFLELIKKLIKKIASNPALRRLILESLTLYFTLTKSKKITLKHKAAIIAALGYFIFPFDIIPDTIPVVGFTDDAGIIFAVYAMIKNVIESSLKKMAKEKFDDFIV